MSRYPMADALTQYNAALPVWSDTATNRLLAANFLKMEGLVESQQESNEIQRRLCGVAEETNDLLRDVGVQLDELSRAQRETNKLLSQALGVQREQLRMAQRERVLKDALFRWQRIFGRNTGEHADAHIDVIGSRTFAAYVSKHEFATADLQDAGEKQQLLNLSQLAAARESQCPNSVRNEVSHFQRLYAEYLNCAGQPPQEKDYAVRNPHAARDEYLSRVVKECFGADWNPSQGPSNFFSEEDRWTREHSKQMRRWLDSPPRFKAFMQGSDIWICTCWWLNRWQSLAVAVTDLLVAPRMKALLCTTANVWTRANAEMAWTKHSYTADGNSAEMEDLEFDETFRRALRCFCKAMHKYRTTDAAVAAAEDQAALRLAAAQWEEARTVHANRLAVMAHHINEYIALHPAAADWYPKVCVGAEYEPYVQLSPALRANVRDTESGKANHAETDSGRSVGGRFAEECSATPRHQSHALQDLQVTLPEGLDTAGVLSQLVSLLKERCTPDDAVATLALSKVVLAELARRGIRTANIEDVKTKRICARLTKMARKYVEDSPATAARMLSKYIATRRRYAAEAVSGIAMFAPTAAPEPAPVDPPPQWTPASESPRWEPRALPQWSPKEEPQPELKQLSKRPSEVPPPEKQPSVPRWTGVKMVNDQPYSVAMTICKDATAEDIIQSTGFDPKYVAAFLEYVGEATLKGELASERGWELSLDGDGTIEYEVYYVPINPDNDWPITVDNVPSLAGTEERFPLSGSLWRSMVGIPPEWKACREYEQALRDWAASIRAYEAYQHTLVEWEKQCATISEHNERIVKEVYPEQLRRFREGESLRLIEWQCAREEHAAAEQRRRAEWEQLVAAHQDAERQRRAAWESECEEHAERQQRQKHEWKTALRQHEMDECRRREEWDSRLRKLCARLTTLGGEINSFLDAHPDIELLCERVDVEQDVESIKARSRADA
jgi:hypothetical protein